MPDFSTLLNEIAKRQTRVKDYLFAEQNRVEYGYQHLEDAVYSYVKAGGKSLRPAVLMFSCGIVGGDEARALPAAAAIEIYHTFTLVHDDIIDHDSLRRGTPTVHVDFANRAQKEMGYPPEAAEQYGLAIAILAGDLQQGWSSWLMSTLAQHAEVNPQLALNLINELFRRVQTILVRGETLDILYAQTPIEKLDEQQVESMLWMKTGVLYEFAGRAGASIGLNQPDLNHALVKQISDFTGKCGIAFQIQDDILGILGNEAQLGKPIGSDIREGKRTLIVLGGLPNMTPAQREFTLKILGNSAATLSEVNEVIDLLKASGGIAHAQNRAQTLVQSALDSIAPLPDSDYKTLLQSWASYIIDRSR
jgi:geranylgeranyl diphosphate synthase type I